MELLSRARSFGPHRTALIDHGSKVGYGELLGRAARFAEALGSGSAGRRVILALPWTASYVVAQWGCWMAGATPVPVNVRAKDGALGSKQLAFILRDSRAAWVVVQEDSSWLKPVLAESAAVKCPTVVVTSRGLPVTGSGLSTFREQLSPHSGSTAFASILYTSGTTGKPKGVPWSHAMMVHNIKTLVQEWRWTPDDHIVNVLPLHHVHGMVNVLGCGLFAGARVEMMPEFNVAELWATLTRDAEQPTLFMAVPTIYHRLLQYRDKNFAKTEADSKISRLRLFVSGSAALPTAVFHRWERLFGHRILERYGMTETGMLISQHLQDQGRRAGEVGYPLKEVQTRVGKCNSENPTFDQRVVGELRVKGPGVFTGYLDRPAETSASFDDDGFFCTGDFVSVDHRGRYRILGRLSMDIIKCGGEKISALELEHALSEHPAISECAVVRGGDSDLGEVPVVFTVITSPVDLPEICQWCLRYGLLGKAQLPRRMEVVDRLPRNAVGKIDKKELMSRL